MWGIVPSAGVERSIQPVACSAELLPVGVRREGDRERLRSVTDALVDRFAAAGVTRVCFVIAPGQSDVVGYHRGEASGRPVVYMVQPQPLGLCDAIFRALPLIRPEEQVMVARPDGLCFPERAAARLRAGGLSFLCAPAADPARFESVLAGDDGEVREIRARRAQEAHAAVEPGTRWAWSAFETDGATLRALHELWCERNRADDPVGDLVNAWIARGGTARAVKAGEVHLDVGTFAGYREAVKLLGEPGAY
jgi:glucose-1-phosphate thymidylyltransferase